MHRPTGTDSTTRNDGFVDLDELRSEALRYLANYPAGAKQSFTGWQSFCRILLSSNQFHYVD